MMTIECIGVPFTYRWPTGEIRLIPGHPVELPDGRAARLLDKAPGRVRVVKSANRVDGDLTGQIVTWESPLFGLLSATVQEDFAHGVRVSHPLTEIDCVIPTTWLRFSPFSPFSPFFPDKS
jgi:hypothetical protein